MNSINKLRKVAESELIDYVGGSQSIEEWSREVINAYHRGKRRPSSMVLIIERYGECYKGELYLTKEDFLNENTD